MQIRGRRELTLQIQMGKIWPCMIITSTSSHGLYLYIHPCSWEEMRSAE